MPMPLSIELYNIFSRERKRFGKRARVFRIIRSHFGFDENIPPRFSTLASSIGEY